MSLLSIPLAAYCFLVTFSIIGDSMMITFWVLVCLGRIAFIVVLHASNEFGVLALDSPDTAKHTRDDRHQDQIDSHLPAHSLE